MLSPAFDIVLCQTCCRVRARPHSVDACRVYRDVSHGSQIVTPTRAGPYRCVPVRDGWHAHTRVRALATAPSPGTAPVLLLLLLFGAAITRKLLISTGRRKARLSTGRGPYREQKARVSLRDAPASLRNAVLLDAVLRGTCRVCPLCQSQHCATEPLQGKPWRRVGIWRHSEVRGKGVVAS